MFLAMIPSFACLLIDVLWGFGDWDGHDTSFHLQSTKTTINDDNALFDPQGKIPKSYGLWYMRLDLVHQNGMITLGSSAVYSFSLAQYRRNES